MTKIELRHFERAALDVGLNGDNDTLPFDIDIRFIKDQHEGLAKVAFKYFQSLESASRRDFSERIKSLNIFFERLLVPTGPTGFRITTKLHPFWNVYLNGLGVVIAELNEPRRSKNAHSYRYIEKGDKLFDVNRSWRAYREATIADSAMDRNDSVVVQTDISSFYEHIYHHRLENSIRDLFPKESTVATQIVRILSKLASGRSFGLPVGGQCSRILAELLMTPIDQVLSDAGIIFHRYVDDYTMIATSQEEAYRSLSVLSHALADYGLSLNRTKTTMLSVKHYKDFVQTQLGDHDDEGKILREIDLHFDPYSDASESEYGLLQETVRQIDIQALLNIEMKKSQPDTFLLAQIGRTLKFQSPLIAIQLCETILNPINLHAFRASWSTIMRGISAVRDDEKNEQIFKNLDMLLDEVPERASHLLMPEANCLHYLRTIRFIRTDKRAKYVSNLFDTTKSETIKRACIDCWRVWKDRASFTKARNMWQKLSEPCQRMLWMSAHDFGDEGTHFRRNVSSTLPRAWSLGIEQDDQITFHTLFEEWASNGI